MECSQMVAVEWYDWLIRAFYHNWEWCVELFRRITNLV